ncbi:hypothetical protein K470DRAFT_258305, partial [Piedraia hortae CBS 480.64]
MTAIPPPKPHQLRPKKRESRGMSVDELLTSWKNDTTLRSNYSGSPGFSVLLDDDTDASCTASPSPSNESVPSLDPDDASVFSLDNIRSPESPRSHKSTNYMREIAQALREDSTHDHPLADKADPFDDTPNTTLIQYEPKSVHKQVTNKSLKSNLTFSLRALKKATLTSLTSSFTLRNATTPAQQSTLGSNFSDEMLWSHPWLFPRSPSEVRPKTPPTLPPPRQLTFEEQEIPFQRALHAPYLHEQPSTTPVLPPVQMQTYNVSRRKPGGERSASRQREVRENGDFLRVVVLEMNMRRAGKLEQGHAVLWLPPRMESTREKMTVGRGRGYVPDRWRGVSVD